MAKTDVLCKYTLTLKICLHHLTKRMQTETQHNPLLVCEMLSFSTQCGGRD